MFFKRNSLLLSHSDVTVVRKRKLYGWQSSILQVMKCKINYCVCVKRITTCSCLCSTFSPSSYSSASRVQEFGIGNRFSWFWKLSIWWIGGEFSFLRAIHIINWYKNWYRHFHNTYGHQIWQAGTSRGVDSHETKEAGSGDVITSRSRDKEKHYISTTRVLISTKHGLMIT